MPTYDYECQACGHRFEHFGKLHETGLRACPNCAKKKAKRLIGAGSGFIFKGSGFYVTDSRAPTNGATAKPDSKPAAAPKTESKPAKKSD
ncbi:MAG TPA: zinc ribbon domain-containing protein [Planctomycetota bacterium]|nr:zinc ribbon domain-containing protein [Planctomycetota bacterium]